MTKSMTRIGTAIGAAILTVGLGSAALSMAGQQQNQAPAQGQRGGPGATDGRGGFGRGRGGPGGPGGPLAGLPLRELNLNDSQREQVRAILDSQQSETRAVAEKAMAA